MAHKVKKQDLDEYVKCLAVNRGCPVDSVDRTKAHWHFIMNRKACMEAIQAYKGDKEYSCSLCGKRFKDRRNRNRHRRQVKCTHKYMTVEDLFKCTMCPKRFTARSNRDRHHRNQHKQQQQ